MSEATPRITAPYLENFQNQTVRLLGKVVQLRGEHATVDAGGQINVILTRVIVPFLLSVKMTDDGFHRIATYKSDTR